MRILTLAALATLVAIAGCAADDSSGSTAPKPVLRPSEGTGAAVGATNTDGEHGASPPAGPAEAPPAGKDVVGDDTWADGKSITDSLSIGAGTTITIAPGAQITVAATVTITVKGTLKVASADKHAKISGPAGWGGLIIAQGGTLTADGLDIDGPPTSALWTQAGDADATYADGTINADTPFKMEAGSKLSVTKVNAKATAGSSLAGTFVASRLNYDKGTGEGITLNDPAGTMTFSDSVLSGSGNSGDYLISNQGHLVKVEYSTISGAHCALHFDALDQYSLDHVSIDTSTYAAMIYGTGAGPNTITDSNIRPLQVGLDQGGVTNGKPNYQNGPLTVTGSFPASSTDMKNVLTKGLGTVTNGAAKAIADAKPRAEAAN